MKFLLILVVAIGYAFISSPHVKADSIDPSDPNEFPNSLTAPGIDNSNSNSDAGTGVLAEVGSTPTGGNKFTLYDANGNASPNTIYTDNSLPATRSEGLYNNISDFEIIMPQLAVSTPGSQQVTIVDACKAVEKYNVGWEDHGFSDQTGVNYVKAYALETNVGSGDYGVDNYSSASGNTSCPSTGGDLTVNVPNNYFQPDPRYGQGMYSAAIQVENNDPNDSKKVFSVVGPWYSYVFPTDTSPYPDNGSGSQCGSTYDSNLPEKPCGAGNNAQYDIINLLNPSPDYFFLTAGDCNYGKNPPNCGKYVSMNEKPDSTASQGTLYNSEGSPNNNGNYPTDNGINTYDFYFKPDCTYNPTNPVYLKWERGAGGSAQTQKGTEKWTLYDMTTQQPVGSPKVVTDGNDSFESQSVGKLTPGDLYRWEWTGVDRAHNLSLWMPFSEFTATSNFASTDCAQPAGNVLAFGDQTKTPNYDNSCTYLYLNAFDQLDPSGNVNFVLYHQETNPNELGYNLSGTVNNQSQAFGGGSEGAQLTADYVAHSSGPGTPGTVNFYLLMQDPTDQNWYWVMSDGNGNYYAAASNITPGGPGSGTPTPPDNNMYDNSVGPYKSVTRTCSSAQQQSLCTSLSEDITGWTHFDKGKARPALMDVSVIDNNRHTLVGGSNESGPASNGSPGDGHLDNESSSGGPQQLTSFTWNYQPAGTQIQIQLINKYHEAGTNLYTPPGFPGPVVYMTQNGGLSTDPNTWITCYSATCSISVTPSTLPDGSQLPADSVLAGSGQSFTVSMTITNTSPGVGPNNVQEWLTPNLDGQPLQMTQGDYTGNKSPPSSNPPGGDFGNFAENVSSTIPPGATSDPLTFTLPTPSNVTYLALWAHPAYPFVFNFGPSSECIAPVRVYSQFNLSGNATGALGPTTENPTQFSFNSYVCNTGSPTSLPVAVNSTTNVYELPESGGNVPIVSNGPFDPVVPPGDCPPQSPDFSPYSSAPYTPYNITSVNAGDAYCASISLAYTSGYVGPGDSNFSWQNGAWIGSDSPDDLQDTSGAYNPSPSCPYVVNEPTFKVLGSGVSAVGFNACNANSELAGWNDDSGLYPGIGSGTQLSALGLGDIVGFASGQGTASFNTPSNAEGTGSTFANDGNNVITSNNDTAQVFQDSPNLGGQFEPNHGCNQEVKAPPNATASNVSSQDVSNLASGTYSNTNSGDLTLTPTSGNFSCVENDVDYYKTGGNVYIENSIGYDGTGSSEDNAGNTCPVGTGWSINPTSNTATLPYFKLLVTGGNIYIDNNVSELSGEYIAQPDPNTGAGGNIYTCANLTGPIQPLNTYSQCNNQLTIHGNFVAQNLNLMRTYGSLRNEQPSAAPNNCSNALNPSSFADSCAAEIFNFSPEMYLEDSNSVINPSPPQYNSFTTLPPIL